MCELGPICDFLDALYWQRNMTKVMLQMVKWAEKNQYVTYFFQLDPVGKSELPCIKAIQESYASKVENWVIIR